MGCPFLRYRDHSPGEGWGSHEAQHPEPHLPSFPPSLCFLFFLHTQKICKLRDPKYQTFFFSYNSGQTPNRKPRLFILYSPFSQSSLELTATTYAPTVTFFLHCSKHNPLLFSNIQTTAKVARTVSTQPGSSTSLLIANLLRYCASPYRQ